MTQDEAIAVARESVEKMDALGIRPRLAAWLLLEIDPRPLLRRRRYRPGVDLPCCFGTADYDDPDYCTCSPWWPNPLPMHERRGPA